MRAFRIIFAEALPLRISLSNRSRSSRLSFTTNFLLAMSRPRVGYSRQLKNQCSRSDATTLFKWYKPLGWPGPSSLSLPTSPLELGLAVPYVNTINMEARGYGPFTSDARAVTHPGARLCCAQRLCAGRRAAGAREGHHATSGARLRLGGDHADGRRQLVLGARDPTVGTMEPHPPLVDLHARNAPARPLASAPPFGAAPSLRHDRTVLRRAGDRGPLHAHSKSHHA